MECVIERESSLSAMIPQSGRDDNSSVIRWGMNIGLVGGSINTQTSLRRSVIWFISSCRDAYISASKREGKRLRIVFCFDLYGVDEWPECCVRGIDSPYVVL